MSALSPLHAAVHKRFHEVFGQPSSVVDVDDHWSLTISAPSAPAINVVVQGASQPPAVWVFDPYVPNDGVMSVAIDNEAVLEDTIQKIRDRLKQAEGR